MRQIFSFLVLLAVSTFSLAQTGPHVNFGYPLTNSTNVIFTHTSTALSGDIGTLPTGVYSIVL